MWVGDAAGWWAGHRWCTGIREQNISFSPGVELSGKASAVGSHPTEAGNYTCARETPHCACLIPTGETKRDVYRDNCNVICLWTNFIWIQEYFHVFFIPWWPSHSLKPTCRVYTGLPSVFVFGHKNTAFLSCLFSHQTKHFAWASALLATLKADRFLNVIFEKRCLFTDWQNGAPDSTVTSWLASPMCMMCLLKSVRKVGPWRTTLYFCLGLIVLLKLLCQVQIAAVLPWPVKVHVMSHWISLKILSCLSGLIF